jgi:hypothetical protein
MKKIDLLLILAVLLFGVGMTNLAYLFNKNVVAPVDLPEEYKSIVPSDRLIGYFDQDSVLHIEFDNSIQFEWEGLEKDIPNNGEYIQITGIDENIVYINPINE